MVQGTEQVKISQQKTVCINTSRCESRWFSCSSSRDPNAGTMVLVDCEVQTEEVEFLLSDVKSGEEGGVTSRRVWDRKLSPRLDYHSVSREAFMRKGIKKCIYLLLILIFLGGTGIIFIGHYCPDPLCSVRSMPRVKDKLGDIGDGINHFHLQTDVVGKPLSDTLRSGTGPSFEDVISRDFQFDIEDHDVIVFLHIQKTGGTTFGKHLVGDLDLARSCACHRKVKKRCTCLRPGVNSDEMWLFSRHSTGWKCGLHADWTELTSCVDDMMDKIEDHEIKRR